MLRSLMSSSMRWRSGVTACVRVIGTSCGLPKPGDPGRRRRSVYDLMYSESEAKGRKSNLVRHLNMALLSHSLFGPINIHARETIISQMIESWLQLLAAIDV